MMADSPPPFSRQSTMGSMGSLGSVVRKSVVSVSGINVDTMSLTSIPPAIESPEPEEYNPRLNGAKKLVSI